MAGGERHQGEVRRAERRNPGGDRRDAAALRTGLSDRSHVPRPQRALPRLSDAAAAGAAVPRQGRSHGRVHGGGVRVDSSYTFEHAAIERPFDGRKIEASDDQGWNWYELDKIDPRRGRLAAGARGRVAPRGRPARALGQQGSEPAARLPAGIATSRMASCAAPLAMIQDLGATFGPKKMDLPNWKRTPMWVDARACRVSMKSAAVRRRHVRRSADLGGGTAASRCELLRPLDAAQLDALFDPAGVTSFDHVIGEAHTPAGLDRCLPREGRSDRVAGPVTAARPS